MIMRKLVVFLKVVFLNEIPEDTTRYESAFSFFNSLSLSLLVERSDADDDYRKIVDHVLIDVMKRVFE